MVKVINSIVIVCWFLTRLYGAEYVVGTIASNGVVNLRANNNGFNNQHNRFHLGDDLHAITNSYQKLIFGIRVNQNGNVLGTLRNLLSGFIDDYKAYSTTNEAQFFQNYFYISGAEQLANLAGEYFSNNFLNMVQNTYSYHFPVYNHNNITAGGIVLPNIYGNDANQGLFTYTKEFTNNLPNHRAVGCLYHTEPKFLFELNARIIQNNIRNVLVVSRFDMCPYCSRLLLNFLATQNNGNYPNILIVSKRVIDNGAVNFLDANAFPEKTQDNLLQKMCNLLINNSNHNTIANRLDVYYNVFDFEWE